MPDFKLREIDRDPLFRMWGINKKIFTARQDIVSSDNISSLALKVMETSESIESTIFSNVIKNSLLLAPMFWLPMVGGIIASVTHQPELSSLLFKGVGLDLALMFAQSFNWANKLSQLGSMKMDFVNRVVGEQTRRKSEFN